MRVVDRFASQSPLSQADSRPVTTQPNNPLHGISLKTMYNRLNNYAATV